MPKYFSCASIVIEASAATVWATLTKQPHVNVWSQAFAKMDIETDWTLNGPVLWKDSAGVIGVQGELEEWKPNEMLRFTVSDAKDAKRALMGPEDGITFWLFEAGGKTTLKVRHGDFSVLPDGATVVETVTASWKNNVLPIIKKEAELI